MWSRAQICLCTVAQSSSHEVFTTLLTTMSLVTAHFEFTYSCIHSYLYSLLSAFTHTCIHSGVHRHISTHSCVCFLLDRYFSLKSFWMFFLCCFTLNYDTSLRELSFPLSVSLYSLRCSILLPTNMVFFRGIIIFYPLIIIFLNDYFLLS